MKVIKSLFLGAALVAGRTIQTQSKSSLMEMRPEAAAKVDPGNAKVCKAIADNIKKYQKDGKWKDKDGKDTTESEQRKAGCTKVGDLEPGYKMCMGDVSGVEDAEDKKGTEFVQSWCNSGSSCCS